MPEKDTKAARAPGPELRLIDRRAFVGFPEAVVAPGVVVQDFALQIPDVTFPMNVSGGASRYQKKKLDFGFLELSVDAEVIHRAVQQLAGRLGELDGLKLHFRPGYLEVQARLRGPELAPLTFKVAFDGDGERLAVYFFDIRFYGFSTTPAARIGALVAEAVKQLGVLPDVERRGASGFSTRVLPTLVEQAAVARGYKMPSLDQARLVEASVSGRGLRLRFSAGGLPPPATPDEELLLALEGSRAFADAEELLATGKLEAAREAYLRLGDATEAHPFAVERLLTLLVADPQAHELALDIAASLARRRERSATAMWAEAVVRERRGELARAAERYLALCSHARKNQEEAGAFFAAEAAARAAREHAPQMAVKALHELLGLKPDHLPSLKALARESDLAKDRAGAIRAYRRLAALARDSAEAADAHVQLARLCAQTEDDIAGARLHCEAALRLAPDHPDALLQLGELCFRSNEHLRAIKALDRLREVAMGRHEVDRVGRANLLAGRVWEEGLHQSENALLRYREAASLLPGEPEPLYLAARVAESLGRVQEALAGLQQAIELAGPAPRSDTLRRTAHDAHHALARLLKTKLGEPARARDHLEAALALDPSDRIALDELLPYFRASGKAAELADACEKSAAVIDEPTRRAALWAEAGELYRGRLGQPDRAERLLTQALEADPKNRQALEGMLALAESKRDGGQLCRCLRALSELAEDPKERVRYARRLAVAARDLAFDIDLAVHAFREVLRVEPDDLPVLGELTALERRRSDMVGLAWALEQRARAAEALGDRRLAASALRELGQVLDVRLGRPGDALVALEKAARLHPEPAALLDLANLSLRLERAPNARRALEDALALLPRHAPPERLAELRAKLGHACELLGDREAAREHYAQAFPLRRLDDELARRLEALYEEAHRTQDLTELWAARAQALLQAGRAHDAAPLFFKAAQTLLAAGDPSGAILRLNAALDASPTGERAAEVLEAMAKLELGRGEPGEAARLYARRAALTLEPRDAARWLFKASTLVQGTPREVPLLTQVLEKDGTFIPARVRHAELVEHSSPADAFADLEVVLQADPKDPDVVGAAMDRPALTRRAAFAALKASQHDAARRLFAQYTAFHPEDTDAQLELVKLHRRAGALEPLIDLLGELWPRLQGPARLLALKEHAEGALSLGRSEAALDSLRAMLKDAPADEWAAATLLSHLPADAGHAHERLELLTRLLGHAAGAPKAELLARRAELHRVTGDLAAARADLLEAAELSPRPLPLLRAVAEVARQGRDEAGELAAWRLVLERAAGDVTLQHDAIERVMALARTRTEANDVVHALAAWELAVNLPLGATERFEAWAGLAHAAKAGGSPRRAEEALLEASKQGPAAKRVEALLERAAMLEGRGAREDAVQAFEAALALAPRHAPAHDGLTRNLRALEDWEGLAEVIAAQAAQTPRATAAPLFIELAALHLDRLGQPGPGEAALRRVVTLDDKNVAARRRLAALVGQRGEVEEAVKLLEQAASLLSAAEAAAVLREGAALAASANDATLALRLMRIANVLAPASGADLERLADALYLHGAVTEALPLQQLLAKAASFDDLPEDAERVMLRLADLAEQAGDVPLAESTLRRVVEERPLHSGAVERLAALVEPRDRRGSFELLARHAERLARSPRTADRLLSLARSAVTSLRDLELAYRLFAAAARAADEPLPVRLEAVEVLRAAGRSPELMAELLEVAQLQLTAGQVDGALRSWDEEARLAEGAGRIDEALRTLTAMSDVCDDEGRSSEAATLLVRRAELLRDSKLDLDAAHEALARAWELDRRSDIAQAAMELARRRGDRTAEIDWLERSLTSIGGPAARAAAFVHLARLHLGLPHDSSDVAQAPLLAPDQAEAALRQALTLEPANAVAEQLLLALLERQDRVGDIAAHFEEAAARSPEPRRRAELLLRAAQLYKDRAHRPQDAAAALLAARAALPDDLELTSRVADLLHQLGRRQEAADFDAMVLEVDPFHSAYARHRASLTESGETLALAVLLSRRAERLQGDPAAAAWLEAAEAFRQASAPERAQLCETQAFEAAPQNAQAFASLLERTAGDPKRQSELLLSRSRAVPSEAAPLLRRRAGLLVSSADALSAAGAWDDYLELAPNDLEALEARAELAASGGGPRGAQPWDRRLLAASKDLPAALKLKTWMRLGQASVEAQAWRDAVDAFEQAHVLDPDGPRGREALSFLSEAYARLRDVDGQYRTTLRLARQAQGAEAEALLRRAASLYDEPQHAAAALEALVAMHPGERDLYEKAVRALAALGRVGELVALHERFAAASGGPLAARALLDAAVLAESELRETDRALELRREAGRLAPDDVETAQALLAEFRTRGDRPGVLGQLEALVRLEPTDGGSNELRLELAELLEGAGRFDEARATLEVVRRGGTAAVGYAQALTGLQQLAERRGDYGALAELTLLTADLLGAGERAARLLDAARSLQRVNDASRAIVIVRESLSARPTREGRELLVELSRQLEQPGTTATALVQLAADARGDDRVRLLLEAADAWEAAGDAAEAMEVLERVLKEAPTAMTPADAAARFARLGASRRALDLAFLPAMEASNFQRALELAEAAGDAQRTTEALWGLAEQHAAPAHLNRLAAQVRDVGDPEALRRLARLLERSGAETQADALWRELVFSHRDEEALERLVLRGRLEPLAEEALTRRSADVLAWLLPHANSLSTARREGLYTAIAELVPERRKAMLRELATLHSSTGAFDRAVEALGQLAAAEEDRRARAALHVERASLQLHQLKDPQAAMLGYERALAEDADQTAAVRELVDLYRTESPERFIVMVERLTAVAGPEASQRYLPAVAEAQVATGRVREAYQLLAQLEETPDRLRRRAALAEQLGLKGEAMALREKVADTREELEEILTGYLRAELVPFAVRLGTRLLEANQLSSATLQLLAERLAPTSQGAALAVRAWPLLLKDRLADADGWTLFGEALRRLSREDAAAMADGFGAALTASTMPSVAVSAHPLVVSSEAFTVEAEGLVPVTAETMPRLAMALSGAVERFAVGGVRFFLDPAGGVEAWMSSPRQLVLGVGALSTFGEPELMYLVALALALGPHGAQLRRSGDVEAVRDAAVRAFDAWPSSLAAARVLGILDGRVRGGDPEGVEFSVLLPDSVAFLAIAAHALELLAG